MDNVVPTPYNATGTIDMRIITTMEAFDTIIRFFNGDSDIPVVNPQTTYYLP